MVTQCTRSRSRPRSWLIRWKIFSKIFGNGILFSITTLCLNCRLTQARSTRLYLTLTTWLTSTRETWPALAQYPNLNEL